MPKSESKPQGGDAPTVDGYSIRAEDVLTRLESDADGLTAAEASARLDRVGPNALRTAQPVSVWTILIDQLKSVIVLLLFVAAGVALVLGDVPDAIAIGAVLAINTAIGFVTELRARRAMEALLQFETPRATAVRDGAEREIDARDLVPGDVIAIDAGEIAPADVRLLRASDLRTDEAALTGESLPVDKEEEVVLDPDTPLPDRVNMIYKGTTVVSGSGRGVVTATGMTTELGRIGGLVSEIREERTPLEDRLNALGRRLVWLTLAVTAFVVGLGWMQGQTLARMIETGIALAIAAVPEGLPAVATITLAVGLRRMARRNALIRRLPSVESLGSATIICTDKTGTLTAGQMTVTELWIAGRSIEITGTGYAPEGEFRDDGQPISAADDPGLARALRTAALPNQGALVETDGRWEARGDPTDVALLTAAAKAGIDRDALLRELPPTDELPFSSERRLAASYHTIDGRLTAYVKGAPENIIARCDRQLTADGDAPLGEEERGLLAEHNRAMAARGLRVIALACGPVENTDPSSLTGLVFVGLAGLIDPPASGVRDTIGAFRRAGIRTVMVTGDQRLTAEAIARDLSVIQPGEEVVDGRELKAMTEEERTARVERIGVFSRISPEDKLNIVEAYQDNGEIVAMLGDGVNDAVALKKANIGVAMGLRGTDVAKEAAAVVLQDDRFQTIGAAIEEGRIIFDNIQKFVFYLFSCNLAEVLVILGASLAGLPLPLLPLQILWLNLVTDTFPALALAFEPAETGLMDKPPRDPEAAILSPPFLGRIGFYSALITGPTLVAFVAGLTTISPNVGHAVTLSFMTLALGQVAHLINARGPLPMITPRRVLTNPYAVGAVILSVSLQLVAVYFGPLSAVLDTQPLRPSDWLIVVGLALTPAVVGQIVKAVGAARRAGRGGGGASS